MATLGSKFIWSSTESNAIFSKLTRLELSMISLYNPITSFQVAGAHYQSKTPVYYIVNDIVDVALKLPRNINEKDFAILRYNKSNGHFKDYYYRPSVVLSALQWLKENNNLYKDVVIDSNVFTCRNIDPQSNDPVVFEHEIGISKEELAELDGSGNVSLSDSRGEADN